MCLRGIFSKVTQLNLRQGSSGLLGFIYSEFNTNEIRSWNRILSRHSNVQCMALVWSGKIIILWVIFKAASRWNIYDNWNLHYCWETHTSNTTNHLPWGSNKWIIPQANRIFSGNRLIRYLDQLGQAIELPLTWCQMENNCAMTWTTVQGVPEWQIINVYFSLSITNRSHIPLLVSLLFWCWVSLLLTPLYSGSSSLQLRPLVGFLWPFY